MCGGYDFFGEEMLFYLVVFVFCFEEIVGVVVVEDVYEELVVVGELFCNMLY